MKKYDAIVIGGGQAGIPLAHGLAGKGWQVALVEEQHLGGSCINYGCTPSKKMIAAARVAHVVRRAPEYGVQAGEVQVDLAQVVAQKDALVRLRRDQLGQRIAENERVTLLRGRARFVGERRIVVEGPDAPGEELSAEKIFINTGAHPQVPPIPGLVGAPYRTNRDIMDLDSLPEHLLVLGGGYVGLEFGQMFRRFGSQVSFVVRGEQIAPREDDDVAAALQAALEKEGICFHLGALVEQVEALPGGGIALALADGRRLSGSHLLVATGQAPNSAALDLAAAGIQADPRGSIQVDDYLQTSAPGVYAMGDVTGGPKFTHIAYNDYQVVFHNMFEPEKVSVRDRIVPYGLFTDPELGRVGLTEKEARRAGRPIQVGKIPMSYVARAIEMGESEGLMKIVVDAESQTILGAAILSAAGGELVQALMALMMAGAPWTVFRQAVFIHPTLAEGFFALMETVA
jgi:pyruvate/2-oxoglutarate dehydrogenase complex dihydrolipoamide dehydrogenase (E3) component